LRFSANPRLQLFAPWLSFGSLGGITFMKITNKTRYQISGMFSCISAFISCIFGYINHDLGTQFPIGMMFLCIGMACFVLGMKQTKKKKQGKSKI
jgi:hypothetical protein